MCVCWPHEKDMMSLRGRNVSVIFNIGYASLHQHSLMNNNYFCIHSKKYKVHFIQRIHDIGIFCGSDTSFFHAFMYEIIISKQHSI